MRLFLLTMALAATAAASTLTITLNTAGLPAGDYLLDFQFINGDSVTGNNTATVSGLGSTNLTSGALSLFGTATGASLVVIARLDRFAAFGLPLLIGLSKIESDDGLFQVKAERPALGLLV